MGVVSRWPGRRENPVAGGVPAAAFSEWGSAVRIRVIVLGVGRAGRRLGGILMSGSPA